MGTNHSLLFHFIEYKKMDIIKVRSIRLKLNTFMPERHYKIVLKIERDGADDTQIHDEGFFFKVVR